MAMNLIVFGPVGSDAPVRVYVPGRGWVVTGGWNPEGVHTVQAAMTIASQAATIKNQALAQKMLDASAEMLKSQDEYLERADVR